jgi:dTDP-L-rhamnose 4-epimerase
MRALVTGGAGFIGSHVVDALVERGVEVVVVDSLHADVHFDVPDYINPRASFMRVDLRDPSAVRRVVDGVDAVCHLAGKVGLGVRFSDVDDYIAHNDVGTGVLLRALDDASFRGRLVLASSMVVYGDGVYACQVHGRVRCGPRPLSRLAAGNFEPVCPSCGRDLSPESIDEDAAPDPRNVYAATKLHQEHLCFVFGREAGVPVTALRYHNVYGPRMPRDTPYAGVASIFRSALEGGSPPEVFEDGGQLRDFVHVHDVARATAMALLSEPPVTGAYNICSGSPRSVLEMAAALAGAFGPDAPAPKVTGAYRLGDVRHVIASPRRARETFGFVAEADFSAGMAELAAAPLRPASPAQTTL